MSHVRTGASICGSIMRMLFKKNMVANFSRVAVPLEQGPKHKVHIFVCREKVYEEAYFRKKEEEQLKALKEKLKGENAKMKEQEDK